LAELPELCTTEVKNRKEIIEFPNSVKVVSSITNNNTALFPVPKCLFLNICSLTKTTNNIRAVTALEADLYANDIDVCVITETHLKSDIPDVIILINNYAVFRRDRCWNNIDKRKNGGVAIYIRNNLKVIEVNRANHFEALSIKVELPSGDIMLIIGVYHPPRPIYDEQALCIYLSESIDAFLNVSPNSVVVCGGDVNQLDIEHLQTMIDITALVDFPTRKDSTLANCLTNKPLLFGTWYSISSTAKTDHKGVILPAGLKLKPQRFKCSFRDYREHRKVALIL
jgi:hypothetical protein